MKVFLFGSCNSLDIIFLNIFNLIVHPCSISSEHWYPSYDNKEKKIIFFSFDILTGILDESAKAKFLLSFVVSSGLENKSLNTENSLSWITSVSILPREEISVEENFRKGVIPSRCSGTSPVSILRVVCESEYWTSCFSLHVPMAWSQELFRSCHWHHVVHTWFPLPSCDVVGCQLWIGCAWAVARLLRQEASELFGFWKAAQP